MLKVISPGDTLANRFELRRRIGSGGMGEVYEAFDRDTAEVIALKTLARADGDTVTRFKREFRALQSTSHPNLVNLRELVRDGDHWFLTMELVEGAPLPRARARRRRQAALGAPPARRRRCASARAAGSSTATSSRRT